MKVDLAAMVRRAGVTRRKVILFPIVQPTLALQGDLAAIDLRVTRGWQSRGREIIVPAYGTAIASVRDRFTDALKMSDDLSDLRNAMEGSTEEANRLVLLLTPYLRAWTVRVERWHRLKWTRNIMTPTSVDLSTILGAEDVQETLDAVLARNVALVRSINDETRARIADIVFRGFQARAQARDIAREIVAATDMSRRRALNIASDQTAKLSAQLDTERMQQLGLTRWTWRHSGKVHYRPEHLARNGNVYTFDNPPPDMPGELPYCGCKKQAMLNLE